MVSTLVGVGSVLGLGIGLGGLTSVPDTCFELIGSHQWYVDNPGFKPQA